MRESGIRKETVQKSLTAICCFILIGVLLALVGCGGKAEKLAKGDPNAPAHSCVYMHNIQRDVYICTVCGKETSGEGLVPVDEDASEAGTPSLKDRGRMLSDNEVEEERRAMDFEDHYRKWVSDEEEMRDWLNSGQQHEEWCVAMDEFIEEILNYSIADVPEESRVLYDQLLARIMDLRDAGR